MSEMKDINEVSGEDFEAEVLRAEMPVVVDFYAVWCGPCKLLGPMLEQVAAGFRGRIKFVKVNVEDAPELAAVYQVSGVPTLALFRGGAMMDALVGLVSPKALKAWLEGAAAATPETPAVSTL